MYKTRSELFAAAAKWCKICEDAGVKALVKFDGGVSSIGDGIEFSCQPQYYEFPIALIEGKEVWADTVLWNVGNFQTIASHIHPTCWNQYSWNPPAPKTVMVELPLETVAWWAGAPPTPAVTDHPFTVATACKKALEALK